MSTTRTHNSSFFLGALAALVVALAAAMGALLLLAYDANPARAAGDCSTASGTTTCTFLNIEGEQTFVVPAGVSSVRVVATGAPGDDGSVRTQGGSPAPAGRGAVVSGNLTGLETGDTLYVNVGAGPTGAGTSDCPQTSLAPNPYNCIGGFNGGGSSRLGAGGGGAGGGASDVRYISRDRSGSLASRLIVAAGGGGGGIGGTCMQIRNIPNPTQPLLGGSGGAAGSDGSDGAACNVISGNTYTISGGKGGKAGTQSAGGAGGVGGTDPYDPDSSNGTSGSLGQGGDGGLHGGGGGGGGYYGGGGGGSGKVCGYSEECQSSMSAGGGGGGGSNLVPQGGTATLTQDTSVPPSVTISYRSGLVGEPPPPTTERPQTKEECKKGGYEEFGYKNQGQCIKAVNHPS